MVKGPVGWSVVAVDPGTTTGLAWAVLGRSELRRLGVTGAMAAAKEDGRLVGEQVQGSNEFDTAAYVLAWQEVWEREALRRTRGRIGSHHRIVIEDFILRERTKERSLLAPVRITAMIEFGLYAYGTGMAVEDREEGEFSSIAVTRQQPSDAKSVATDERLRKWGLWHAGSPHVRDAIRHLVVYFRRLEQGL